MILQRVFADSGLVEIILSQAFSHLKGNERDSWSETKEKFRHI